MTIDYAKELNKVRGSILERDNHACKFCGSTYRLTVHHIRPVRMGGNHEPYNLVTLCPTCHNIIHQDIRQNGLATIPGPEWEPYRDYLTNPEDVAEYMASL